MKEENFGVSLILFLIFFSYVILSIAALKEVYLQLGIQTSDLFVCLAAPFTFGGAILFALILLIF